MHATGAVDTDGALSLSEDERQGLEGWRAVVPCGVVAIAPVLTSSKGQWADGREGGIEQMKTITVVDSVMSRN